MRLRLARFTEVLRSHPDLSKRIEAVRLFADSALYRKLSGGDPAGGTSGDALDRRVSEIVSA